MADADRTPHGEQERRQVVTIAALALVVLVVLVVAYMADPQR